MPTCLTIPRSLSRQNASPLRLHCRIISGERLLAMDHGKTSDPYVVIKVGHVSIKSTSKAKTLSPVWNEDYDLGVEQLNGSIKIELFDKDLVSDDSLGTAEVDLSSVPHGHPRDFTLQVRAPLSSISSLSSLAADP